MPPVNTCCSTVSVTVSVSLALKIRDRVSRGTYHFLVKMPHTSASIYDTNGKLFHIITCDIVFVRATSCVVCQYGLRYCRYCVPLVIILSTVSYQLCTVYTMQTVEAWMKEMEKRPFSLICGGYTSSINKTDQVWLLNTEKSYPLKYRLNT